MTVETATRERLLSCAEELFAQSPFDAVSVRAICAAAHANVAAVHYHFGTKEDLVVALLDERLVPRWRDALDGLTAASPVPDVVDAILTPFIEIQSDALGRTHLHLLARLIADAPHARRPKGWTSLRRWSATLPNVDEKSARARWALAFDLILTSFGRTGATPLSPDAIAALRDFVIAGLTAPPTPAP
ncbi:MAG TPA: TetR/AcrR family transcriptional regulator [Gordonia sp. (in: high G+C Gram-positive bacteria)]|uniref:TetR/AcrR family transcriptional regulator n=1 Tax=unclassified Gordonia (in: high G+C Gram-positive bacteria) TaxID=2657482 RepID=UPI0025BF9ADB|nr:MULTISPECIES: TetR/AcrR family transcriptional regulator [unclassified Gordonia (in: high G+C Gram-positive bacteria)]HNP56582.1 TetR/AcrR family transcriptional regulator [Gordonia sp. (in: high G+C Gram-positive bacteria)]HRC49671.1 TetR/AcrR family transcriptional regulator [Gordonia sp. (in: high G+C Gram-positive bacteria)]